MRVRLFLIPMIAAAAALLAADTSAWAQLHDLRKVLEKTAAKKVVIDHHVSSDDLGAVEFKDTTASATGVLISEFAEALGVTPSSVQATCLFAAIATDTGWFRFPSTRSETMRIAARLMDLGVEPHQLFASLYERRSLARVKLAGRVLSRIELSCEGRLGHTHVSLEDFKATGAKPVDTEDLVNECLMIEGTRAAFIAIEQLNRSIKVSFRSRSDLNVAAIAERFGGGGHKQAAGAVFTGGSLPQVMAQVLAAMQSAMGCESGTAAP